MAIQVNGTEVISNSRALNNIASVDATTAAAITAAGVGGSGFSFTPVSAASSQVVSDGTAFCSYDTNSQKVIYSADGSSWTSYSISGMNSPWSGWNVRYFGGQIDYWILWRAGRDMYITSDPSSAGNWTYRSLYGGYGSVQTITMSWGYDRSNNYINPSSPRIHAGHGWTGAANSWGTSFSDNLGASWSTGQPSSNGNHSYGYIYSPSLGRAHFGNEAFQWKTGSQSWNGSYPSFSTSTLTMEGSEVNTWVKNINSTTDMHLRRNSSNSTLVSLAQSSTSTTQLHILPNNTKQVLWDSANSQYIGASQNVLYTSGNGDVWGANFSPTGGADIYSMAIGSGKLAVQGNNAIFVTDI